MEVRRVWIHGHPIFEHSEAFQQPTSLSQVGPSHPTSIVHAGGKLSSSVGHVESKQSATTSHVDTIEKTGRLKCKLSSLVSYAREIILLTSSLLSQRCKECGPRLRIFLLLNNL